MPFQSMDSSVLWLASLPLLLSLLCVDVDGATIIPSYAAAFVNAHNVKRCMHGVPLMTWSAAVEATAVTWAATCSGVHTNLTVRMNDWFGENLWGVSGMEPFPQGAVKLWYDEISMYDWSIPILQPGTGHLTQVIWRESVNLGCAMCDRGDGWKWVVCQYNPPGNAPGNNEILPPIKSEAECIAEILPNSYNCVDDPVGWTDSMGRTCATYAQQGYCQPDGTVGPNWNGAWGPAATYASQGRDAFQACCACGGGRFVSPSPSATPSPSPSPSPSHSIPKSPPPYVPDSSNCVDDPVGWKDSYGWACSSYLSDNWCTTDGATGSGWQSWWGPISRYANQGKDAFAACCACGGGQFVSPSPSLSASPYTPSPSPSLSPSPSASPTSPSRSPSPPPISPLPSLSASASTSASPIPSASASPPPSPTAAASTSPSPLPSTAGLKCADEGGVCACNGLVQYGVGTFWTAPRDISAQVACNNNQFGDPRPGKVKACFCLSTGTGIAATAAAAADDATAAPPLGDPAGPPSNVWPWLALPFALLALGLVLGALFCLHRHRRALRAETFLDVEDITAPPCLAPTTCASPMPLAMTISDNAPFSSGGRLSPVAPPSSPSPSPLPTDPYDI
eukprot:EG_transcript_2198